MAAFQFHFPSGKQKSRVGGDDSRVVFGQKFLSGTKGNVKRRLVVMQQPVLLLPKFGTKFSHIFTQSP
jgi:hypothetical protein